MNILVAVVAATKAARATGEAYIVSTSSTAGGYRVDPAGNTFALAPFDNTRYTVHPNGTRYNHY